MYMYNTVISKIPKANNGIDVRKGTEYVKMLLLTNSVKRIKSAKYHTRKYFSSNCCFSQLSFWQNVFRKGTMQHNLSHLISVYLEDQLQQKSNGLAQKSLVEDQQMND